MILLAALAIVLIAIFVGAQTRRTTDRLKHIADNPTGRRVSPERDEATQMQVFNEQARRMVIREQMRGRRPHGRRRMSTPQKVGTALLGYELLRHVLPHHEDHDPNYGFHPYDLDGNR